MLKVQMNGVIYEIDYINDISEFVAINPATGQSVSDPNTLAGLFATGRQIDYLQKALNPTNGFLHDLSKGAIEEQQALDRIILWEGAKFLLEAVSSFFVDFYFRRISKAELLLDLQGLTEQLDLGTAMAKNMLLLAIIDSYLVQAKQHISKALTSNGWLQLEQSGAVIDATEVETTTSLALSAVELFLLRTQQVDASEITQSDGFIYDYAAFWAKLAVRTLPGYEILSKLKWGIDQAVDLSQIADLIEVVGTNVETSTMFDQDDLDHLQAAFVARENGQINSDITPSNITSYPTHTLGEYRNKDSFAAIKADGSVVAWGGSSGNSTISGAVDVRQIYSTVLAFAALRVDGSVVTWGIGSHGGDISNVANLLNGIVDVVQIYSTEGAFAALRADGSVVTWGNIGYGSDSSNVASALNGAVDVMQIYSTVAAFAALRADGSVVTWGDNGYGSDSSAVTDALSGTVDVTQIYSTARAFAALRADGSVITWGVSFYGGDSSTVASALNGTVDIAQIYSTSSAFAALRADGSVITWGDSNGGNSASVASALNGLVDVTHISSTTGAFAALRADGSVITWGNTLYGGDSTSVTSALNGTVDVTHIYSTAVAFAALRVDGSVVTWGGVNFISGENTGSSGDSSNVANALSGNIDVTEIYATADAFAALRADGSVITWGSAGDGGNSSTVAGALNGAVDVTQIYSTERAFAALRADGSVVTWGNNNYGGDGSNLVNQLNSGVVGVVGLADINTDDVFATVPVWQITSNVSVVSETDGAIQFTITRSDAQLDVQETVYVSTAQVHGSLNQSDYASLLNQPVTFAVGQKTKTIAANILSDNITDPDEQFGLIVQANPTDPVWTTLASTTFTIRDVPSILTINGSANNDDLKGTIGNDAIMALSGDDILTGKRGNDTLDGGTHSQFGGDTASYSIATSAVVVSLSAGTATGGDDHDTLIGIENLIGSAHADTLTGDANPNVLDGGAGTDNLIGGLGNDFYHVDNAGDVVAEKLNQGIDLISSKVTYTLPTNVENLALMTGALLINGTGNGLVNVITGNESNNQLNGAAGNDNLSGKEGNDTLNGGAGVDSLTGGLGNDIYVIDNASDVVTENLNEGADRINSSITYILPVNVENLTLMGVGVTNGTGNDQNNVITGNGAANQLNGQAGNDTLNGGAGDDTLTGWSGADTMIGGSGNDSYFVENTGDIVTEGLNAGIDSVSSRLTYTLPVNVENLILTGTSVVNGTGNGLANTITGNGAANQLNGGANNDTLNGGAGNDILDGGTGTNNLTGGTGNDFFKFTTTDHIDTITDYNVTNDTIQLENAVYTQLATTGALAAGQFRVGAQALDNNDFVIYNNVTGALLYDADGSGATAAVQVAILSAGLVMTSAEIVVI